MNVDPLRTYALSLGLYIYDVYIYMYSIKPCTLPAACIAPGILYMVNLHIIYTLINCVFIYRPIYAGVHIVTIPLLLKD